MRVIVSLTRPQVAFGTVTQLVLEGRPREELDTVYGFCCAVGLPVTLAQASVAFAPHVPPASPARHALVHSFLQPSRRPRACFYRLAWTPATLPC